MRDSHRGISDLLWKVVAVLPSAEPTEQLAMVMGEQLDPVVGLAALGLVEVAVEHGVVVAEAEVHADEEALEVAEVVVDHVISSVPEQNTNHLHQTTLPAEVEGQEALKEA